MRAFLFLIAFSFTSILSSASILTAVTSGDWTSSTTWNTNSTPSNGDVAIIPAGKTVTISSNVDLATSNIMVLDYGVLAISGGSSSLTLGTLSEIVVYSGGDITNGSGNGSHTINIGSSQVYKGNQGTVYGPQYATILTSGFKSFSSLPLSFVSFSLSAAKQGVTVEWLTAQEVDVDHFEIERSLNGTTWTSAGRIAAKGSTAKNVYEYTDVAASGATIYYRVKEVDRNGIFSFSAIKSINNVVNAAAAVTIRPAGQGNIVIAFSQPLGQSVVVRMISLSGQVVKQQALTAAGGQVMLNTGLKGDYIIQITNGNSINTASQMIL